ncbi:MAG: glycosyltransferase family 4 protein [Chloroflexota bacterium]
MKVANIIETNQFGGPQVRILGVANILKKEGIQTVVICPNNADIFVQKLAQADIPCFAIPLHRITKHLPHLLAFIFFFLPELFNLIRIIKQQNIDVVHCNGSWQIKGILAGRWAGAKTIWHLNDTFMPKPIKLLFSLVAKVGGDGFIVASERTKQFYLANTNLTERPTTTIQAPVDTQLFNPNSVALDATIADLPGIKVVTVGNLNPGKGIDVFLDMAHWLNKTLQDTISFAVVGPVYNSQEKYAAQLRQQVQDLNLDNVHFIGWSDNLKGILKATDIYVCPSWYEASPISIWEAVSMATPVVTTDVGDVTELVAKNQCGFVVPTGDAQALADQVTKLIQDNALRQQMGRQARLVAEQKLDIAICAARHAEFYRSILS